MQHLFYLLTQKCEINTCFQVFISVTMFYLYQVGPTGLEYIKDAYNLGEIIPTEPGNEIGELPPHPGMLAANNYIWHNKTPFDYYPRSARNRGRFFVIADHLLEGQPNTEPRFRLEIHPDTTDISDLFDLFIESSKLVNGYNYLTKTLSVSIAECQELEDYYLSSPLFGHECDHLGYFQPRTLTIHRDKLTYTYPGLKVAFGAADFQLSRFHGCAKNQFEVIEIDGELYLTTAETRYLKTIICCIDQDLKCWLPNRQQHNNLMTMTNCYDYRPNALFKFFQVQGCSWINHDYIIYRLLKLAEIDLNHFSDTFKTDLTRLVVGFNQTPSDVTNVRKLLRLTGKKDKEISNILHEM